MNTTKFTPEQVRYLNRRTRLCAESIAESICDSMAEAEFGVPEAEIEKFYGTLIASIEESVQIELEEYGR